MFEVETFDKVREDRIRAMLADEHFEARKKRLETVNQLIADIEGKLTANAIEVSVGVYAGEDESSDLTVNLSWDEWRESRESSPVWKIVLLKFENGCLRNKKQFARTSSWERLKYGEYLETLVEEVLRKACVLKEERRGFSSLPSLDDIPF